MKTEAIAKQYTTFEQFANSEEIKAIFAPYAAHELKSTLKVKARAKFISAYVVNVDPDNNYGRAFKLYHHYQLYEDGLKIIKEVNAHSCMHNGPLMLCIINKTNLKHELIFNTNWRANNDKETRRKIAALELTIWS